MVSLRLRDADEDATRHFCDVLAMTEVPRYALSFDGLATKINHHRSVSEYFTAEAEVRRIGVDRLVRLGIGVEHERDLAACLNWALWQRARGAGRRRCTAVAGAHAGAAPWAFLNTTR